MVNEARIKVKKRFLSPLTNRLLAIDSEMNVPLNRFWMRRLAEKDCEKIKSKVRAKTVTQPKKGSK